MTLENLRDFFVSELTTTHSKVEAETFFYIFIEEKNKLSKADFLLNSQRQVEDLFFFQEVVSKLKKEVPYQYILGSVQFASLSLKVTPDVLIPRPETEEMAYLIKDFFQNKNPNAILDIGTGTGCLALSCKSFFPESKVAALDFSKAALKIARENASANNLEIEFSESDFLDESQWPSGKYELIVSNPPYIAFSEKQKMESVVLENEPHLALFVADEKPLIFYEKIAAFASKNLSPKGRVFVEINQAFGKETLGVFHQENFEGKLLQDLSGNDRFVEAWKKA